MVLAQLAFHPLQQLGLELRRTQAPTSPQRLPLRAISRNLETGLLTGLRQGLQEILPIHGVEKDVAFAIGATHHVIDRTGIFDSQFARHGDKIIKDTAPVKTLV